MGSYCYRRDREISNPSFSSTLLDAIYRSIDEAGDDDDEELVLYRETMRKKHSNFGSFGRDQERILNFQRACMIEKWMEKKKVSETKVVLRRKSTADFDTKSRNDPRAMLFFNSSSSTSSDDSSSGGGGGGRGGEGFSSSEAESVYNYGTVFSSRSPSSCYGLQKPKPIRTSVSVQPQEKLMKKLHHEDRRHAPQAKPKQKQKDEGGFSKTKSRALKIYGDLKKAKQPISPGGRLASFLNSLFTAGGNTKKAKISSSSSNDDDDITSASGRKLLKPANASSMTCSSASSFSRSCLSKTPSSSRGKSSNGGGTTTKRSVRFYPVSVIVDEDCQPCGQKSLYDHDKQSLRTTTTSIISSEELKFHIMEKNRRVEEAARDLLRNYQRKKVETHDIIDARDAHTKKDQVFPRVDDVDGADEEDEEDAASYASSDLFELDNLSAIGMERYREELPVYETTHLDTNRAIANGLIL